MAALARASAQLEVSLVNVRSEPVYFAELSTDAARSLDEAVRQGQAQLLKEAVAQAQAAGLTVSATLAPVGTPAAQIVREAEEMGADQIVMGTRGMGAAGSPFMGSVAQRVVHMAKVPVLLVK